MSPPSLRTVGREWTRIGCLGFGGPPAHVALLRELCVGREWISAQEFEDALAAVSLLPGPASTQLAIYCAQRLRGTAGALLGAAGFILPGLVAILALSAAFLADAPPGWLLGAGLGAGAAVPAVAVHAGLSLVRPTLARVPYLAAGAVAGAVAGPWLVVVLVGAGAVELVRRGHRPPLAALAPAGGIGALAWTALKVGALSYGGGFVIVPLMQGDAVHVHHWMTDGQFLDAVALGQVTPGPVTHTVAAVGYAAAGVGGALIAAAIAFAPSLAFVWLGANRFQRLVRDPRVRAFVDGAAPASLGAILGSAVPLALALSHAWQAAVLAVAAVALLGLRIGVVGVLVAAGVAGAVIGA